MSKAFQSRDERFRTFILMRKERWDHYKAIVTFRMKYYTAIFTTFLTVTGIYYQSLPDNISKCFLFMSWLTIVIGIGFLFLNFNMISSWIFKKMNYEDQLYLYENNDAEHKEIDKLSNTTDCISYLTDTLFFLGLLLYFLFLITKNI